MVVLHVKSNLFSFHTSNTSFLTTSRIWPFGFWSEALPQVPWLSSCTSGCVHKGAGRPAACFQPSCAFE